MIDVAHNGDNRRTRDKMLARVRRIEQTFFNVRLGNTLNGVAKLFRHKLGGIGVDHIGDLDHLALLHKEADNVNGTLGHTVGEFLNRNRFWNDNFTRNLFFGLNLLMTFETLHTAFEGRKRTNALFIITRCACNGQTAAALIIDARRWFGRNRNANRRSATGAADGCLALFFIGLKHGRTRTARRYDDAFRRSGRYRLFTLAFT